MNCLRSQPRGVWGRADGKALDQDLLLLRPHLPLVPAAHRYPCRLLSASLHLCSGLMLEAPRWPLGWLSCSQLTHSPHFISTCLFRPCKAWEWVMAECFRSLPARGSEGRRGKPGEQALQVLDLHFQAGPPPCASAGRC